MNLKKGRVREAIISLLQARPLSLSEISYTLGISKSTSKYHIDLLLREGIIKIHSMSVIDGRLRSKRYQLKMASHSYQAKDASELEEIIHRETLKFKTEQVSAVEFFSYCLYHLLRTIRFIAFHDQNIICRQVGSELSKPFVSLIIGNQLFEVFSEFCNIINNAEVAKVSLSKSPGRIYLNISGFLNSYSYDETIEHFLLGLLDGILREKFGKRYSIKPEVSKIWTFSFCISRGQC